ncbi:MAG: outer membrane protein assembly factor BamA, partial [Candidatus Omnitrophota bacterium]|nr:outer membrane protein assembly factor BamA [Candidatus Omnitrophota bacterium]
MMRLKLCLTIFLIFLLTCAGGVFSFAQGAEKKKVKEIRIVNNKVVSSATIRSKLRIRKGITFSQDILNEDMRRLYELGFFEDITIDAEEKEDGYIISFIVTEKPVVDTIIFKGNKAIKKAKLKEEVSVKEEEMLDRSKLRRDLITIRKLYESKGFQLANVDYDIKRKENISRVKIVFNINEKQRIVVKKIDILGNHSIKDKELKKLMLTKTQFFLFIQPGYFQSDEFEADMERIKAYYHRKGFLDVKVEADFEYGKDGTEMYITFNINEGKQYAAGSVKITGIKHFPENEIRKALEMTSGESFSEAAMRQDVINIQQYYYDRGYMNCDISSDTVLDAATGNINVIYGITENELVYIERVRIQGNTKTRDVVIRREMRAYPGEPFCGAEIRRSKERLYNLGYFEEVVFDTEPGSAPDKKDLIITVKETKTGEFSFGGGFSSIDKFIGFAQVSQRNFDAVNFPTFTGGGQDLNVRAELGTVRQNYIVSWTDPWILGYPLLFGFDVYQTEFDRSSDSGYLFNEQRRGGDIRLGKEITEYFRADAIYKL